MHDEFPWADEEPGAVLKEDVRYLGDIMTRVRDHMRAQPPRSAAPRKRRTRSET
ncbi:hypothetical protein GCM10012278_69860 [Nonomuraea glycinis]|uniref:Uncharacterized protein n=1 Tax=Nonomuraea glycinis TaxID=2047744 RepID=A0A918AB89_9ACTN|nr:hypothetical protein GCM10012278_69860 [Nonomuraea glycinis]